MTRFRSIRTLCARVGGSAERGGAEEAGAGEADAEGAHRHEPPPQRRHAAAATLLPRGGGGGYDLHVQLVCTCTVLCTQGTERIGSEERETNKLLDIDRACDL